MIVHLVHGTVTDGRGVPPTGDRQDEVLECNILGVVHIQLASITSVWEHHNVITVHQHDVAWQISRNKSDPEEIEKLLWSVDPDNHEHPDIKTHSTNP